jgi:phospholipid/cholesterol/gamma-HCH transport system permease protein
MTTADWRLYDRNGETTLHTIGDWTALNLGNALVRLSARLGGRGEIQRLDLSDLGRVDTAGALALFQFVPKDIDCGAREDLRRLFELARPALSEEAPFRPGSGGLAGFLDRFGRQVVRLGGEAYDMLDFTGPLVVALGRTIGHPRRLRLTPLVAMMQGAGVNALPIVFVMTFFIGAAIALVGTNLLTTLGVEVFTVQLVGVAILREFGVVIAAILLTGSGLRPIRSRSRNQPS